MLQRITFYTFHVKNIYRCVKYDNSAWGFFCVAAEWFNKDVLNHHKALGDLKKEYLFVSVYVCVCGV
jgi:hypothetical protein